MSTYKLDGVRLTNIEQADTAFLNRFIEQLKAAGAYVIANAESDADFDAKFYNDTAANFTNAFKNVDLNTTVLEPHIEEMLSGTPVLSMTGYNLVGPLYIGGDRGRYVSADTQ